MLMDGWMDENVYRQNKFFHVKTVHLGLCRGRLTRQVM